MFQRHTTSTILGFILAYILPSVSLAQNADELYPPKALKATVGGKIDLSGSTSIPSGNYSGIAWIGGNRYIVISDKKVDTENENTNSWQTFSITTSEDGTPQNVIFEGSTMLKSQEGTDISRNDAEGIVFVPKANSLYGLDASEGGTVFISAESDQKILEYDLQGKLTGRQLDIPEQMANDRIFANYGFEALTYSPERREFWTTTEQGLKTDITNVSSPTNAVPTYLRMVRFNDNLKMEKQYAYKTEAPTAKSTSSKYAFGVPELTALPDGTLIVCEREFFVGDGIGILNSFVNVNLYRAYPDEASETNFSESLKDLPNERFMRKELLTSLSSTILDIANYEGMCLAPKMQNGSYNLLMINDSQNRYKDALGEYITNVTLTESEDPADNMKENISNPSNSYVAYDINGSTIPGSIAKALTNASTLGHSFANAFKNASMIIFNGKKYAVNNK